MNGEMKRRRFIQTTAAGTAGLTFAHRIAIADASQSKPAILGGEAIRKDPFPSWPQIQENDEKAWADVLQKKGWCRLDGGYAQQFEKAYADLLGAKDCIVTANGTSALFASLNALNIGPGDEVIVPPYTFVATINVVLLQHALPVFVDTDRESFQIDAKKIEAAITENTKCIMPVHLGGNVADMDTILEVANRHQIPVIEDACQSHLAEWKGKKVGTLGHTGCFSFQVTKNLSGGEGGAIVSNDMDIMDRCYSFHTNGRERTNRYGYAYRYNGANLRMTEFQAALLLQQMTRLEEQAKRREENAAHLTKRLSEIPGIHPAKMYDGCTRNAYHLYMMRYDPEGFAGMDRKRFLDALSKEGIPCSSGYRPLNQEPFLKETLTTRGYQKIYGKDAIDQYLEKNRLPENDRLCNDAVWFFQTMLLGTKEDMDQIANAVEKIHAHAKEIAKA